MEFWGGHDRPPIVTRQARVLPFRMEFLGGMTALQLLLVKVFD